MVPKTIMSPYAKNYHEKQVRHGDCLEEIQVMAANGEQPTGDKPARIHHTGRHAVHKHKPWAFLIDSVNQQFRKKNKDHAYDDYPEAAFYFCRAEHHHRGNHAGCTDCASYRYPQHLQHMDGNA